MQISEYNINYGNLDPEHVELLKKQILSGSDILIRYYKRDGEDYVIDGGHAFTAYTQLGRVPPLLVEVPFTTPEDMIALSRHCNVNRLQQAPVSYTESVVKEVKLRLKIEDNEVKSKFYRYEDVKAGKVKGGNSADVCGILEGIFENEHGMLGKSVDAKIHNFRLNYLPLLKLEPELKKMVDKGDLGKSHAGEIAKIKNTEKQEKVVKIVVEDEISYRDTKELVERVEKKGESPEYAAYHVLEKKAMKLFSEAPEHKSMMERVESPPLPEGIFDVIYADPPWEYEFSVSDSRAIDSHYPTMSLEDICAKKTELENKLADDCVLFLWVPGPKLIEGLQVIESWGFEYKTDAVWIKDKIGMGYYFRKKHELLLLATKGNPQIPKPENRPEDVINSPRTEHSKKPEIVYEIIEKMFPNSNYLEMFSRLKRERWTSWGVDVE